MCVGGMGAENWVHGLISRVGVGQLGVECVQGAGMPRREEAKPCVLVAERTALHTRSALKPRPLHPHS